MRPGCRARIGFGWARPFRLSKCVCQLRSQLSAFLLPHHGSIEEAFDRHCYAGPATQNAGDDRRSDVSMRQTPLMQHPAIDEVTITSVHHSRHTKIIGALDGLVDLPVEGDSASTTIRIGGDHGIRRDRRAAIDQRIRFVAGPVVNDDR